jgi:hypothetical protein
MAVRNLLHNQIMYLVTVHTYNQSAMSIPDSDL